MVTRVVPDTLRLVGRPSKKSKKSVGKGSVALLKETFQWGCVCPNTEKVYSAERWEIGIESHNQILEDHDASCKNWRKEGSIAGNHSKNANLKSEFRERSGLRGKKAK